MNRKMIYVFSLVGFFLMWGVFGFAAAAPRTEPYQQATIPTMENTVVSGGTTDNSAGIPVTGEPEPVWTEILGFYGMIGLAALFLVLALLSFANKLANPPMERKGPPEETHKHY